MCCPLSKTPEVTKSLSNVGHKEESLEIFCSFAYKRETKEEADTSAKFSSKLLSEMLQYWLIYCLGKCRNWQTSMT